MASSCAEVRASTALDRTFWDKSLKELTKLGVQEYEDMERMPWVKTHVVQIVLTVAMMFWVREVETRLTTADDKPIAPADGALTRSLSTIDPEAARSKESE